MSVWPRAITRKSLLSLLLVPMGLAAWGSAQASTTYHVRVDGGDASQCNGRADAPYPGSGTGQACAWKHPFYALPPGGGAPRIAGGDTLIIGGGSYMMGQGAPGATNCTAGSCFMAPIPSGPSATARTRILGKAGTTPQLWGTERASRIINIQGRSNIEVGNLEITDRSDCVFQHSALVAACKTDAAPYGQWARTGVYGSASSNVWLHDLNIHGLAHMGINAGGLTNWTLDRVRINKNGRAGWDANVGDTVSNNSGQMVLRNVEVAWNGCGERWQTGEVWACWAQQTGGYGDGIGTYYTGGEWLIEDSFIHHNTNDGLDLRYMDGEPTTTVTVRRLYAVGNAGNQAKIRGNSVIENSVLVSNCAYFRGRDYMVELDNCRAAGNTLQLVLTAEDRVLVRHNTITGEGGTLIGANEGDSTGRIRIENNVLIGFPRWDDATTQSSVYYANAAPAAVSWGGNLVWKVKNNTCPPGSICGQDPKLTNMTLASFDAAPLPGSPVADRVVQLPDLVHDFLLQPRPSGAASDVGAYELQVAAACAAAAPTVALTGPAAPVAAGTTNTYSVSVTNNDSATCASTTFNLARSVPAGWTGTLSAATLTLAPGAASTATVQVTSPVAATVGEYGIGIGLSSTVGTVHTASASTVYSIMAVCAAAAPTVTLTGPTAAVAAGTTNAYTVTVTNNDSSVCANTTFNLARTVPAGWTGSLSAATVVLAPGASSATTLQVTSPTTATVGDYGIGIGASSSVGAIHTGSAATTYAVKAVCTVAAPTLTLTGPTEAVAAGFSNTYDITFINNDSAACPSTTFSLAHSVPSGWAGALSVASLTAAPGARSTATLQVTSAGNATEGQYGIGVGLASAAGSVHSANASALFAVKVVEAVKSTLSQTVSTSKTAYALGETVVMTALVLKDGVALSGADVRFGALKPDGVSEIVLRAVTDSQGYARASFVSGTTADAVGTYRLRVDASSGTLADTASTSFTVGNILTGTVATNRSSYTRGMSVKMTSRVLKDGNPVQGASVRFGTMKPDGVTEIVLTGTTDSQGYAKASLDTGTDASWAGTFKLRVDASSGELSAVAGSTFSVK